MSSRNYQKQNGKVLKVSLKLACIKLYWFNMTCLNLTALKEWELTTTETRKTHDGQTFCYSNSDSKPDRRNNNHWVKGIASEPVKTFIHYMHKASNERGIGGRKVRPEFLLLPPWPPLSLLVVAIMFFPGQSWTLKFWALAWKCAAHEIYPINNLLIDFSTGTILEFQVC